MKLYFQNNFALDFRSLAIFRICLGVLILIDVILRLNHFTMHYTEDGIVPRELLLDPSQEKYKKWSVFLLSTSTVWAVFLFIVLIYFTICFTLGFKTRTHTLLLWVLVVSMQARCPYICFGADAVIRVLLFWCLFLPLARQWSFDSRKKDAENKPVPSQSYFSMAVIAYTLQITMIYWFNAVSKGHPMWRVDYTAVELVLTLESFSTNLGSWLLQFPSLLKVFTKGTLLLEELGPLLLFIPLFRNYLRGVAVILFIGFHIGLALTMHLGVFPYVCMIAWIPFLPSVFWEKMDQSKVLKQGIEIHRNKWQTSFCGMMCLYVFLWNARTLTREKSVWFLPAEMNVIADITRVGQKWHLFAPRTRTNDLWLLVSIKHGEDSSLKFLNGESASDFENISKSMDLYYSGCRERGFISGLFRDKNLLRISYFAAYLSEKNGVKPQDVVIQIIEDEHFHPKDFTKYWKMWPYTDIIKLDDDFNFVEVSQIAK